MSRYVLTDSMPIRPASHASLVSTTARGAQPSPSVRDASLDSSLKADQTDLLRNAFQSVQPRPSSRSTESVFLVSKDAAFVLRTACATPAIPADS